MLSCSGYWLPWLLRDLGSMEKTGIVKIKALKDDCFRSSSALMLLGVTTIDLLVFVGSSTSCDNLFSNITGADDTPFIIPTPSFIVLNQHLLHLILTNALVTLW
jgi:hypothetical protein